MIKGNYLYIYKGIPLVSDNKKEWKLLIETNALFYDKKMHLIYNHWDVIEYFMENNNLTLTDYKKNYIEDCLLNKDKETNTYENFIMEYSEEFVDWLFFKKVINVRIEEIPNELIEKYGEEFLEKAVNEEIFTEQWKEDYDYFAINDLDTMKNTIDNILETQKNYIDWVKYKFSEKYCVEERGMVLLSKEEEM